MGAITATESLIVSLFFVSFLEGRYSRILTYPVAENQMSRGVCHVDGDGGLPGSVSTPSAFDARMNSPSIMTQSPKPTKGPQMDRLGCLQHHLFLINRTLHYDLLPILRSTGGLWTLLTVQSARIREVQPGVLPRRVLECE